MGSSDLGVGVVWWPPLDALFRDSEGLIDVVEAEPEAFWVRRPNGRGFRSILADALRHLSQPKLLHGVGAPLGGTCPGPDGHMETLVRDVAAVCPEFVSEHLSFTHFRPSCNEPPVFAGFMLQPMQSPSGVALAAANIRRHQGCLGGIPLAVETAVSYLPPAPGEWADGAFVAAVADTADCGILLDLHNALCNARNGRQSVEAFCETIPLDRVWELHLAGGQTEAGFRLDAHSGLVEPELKIAAALVPRLPRLRVITFEIMPERVPATGLAAIARQLGRMRDLWNVRTACCAMNASSTKPRPSANPSLNPAAWEQLLGCAISNLPGPVMDDETAAWMRSSATAIDLYRKLVGEGRASSVATAAPRTTRLLLCHSGGPGTRRILAEFWRETPPREAAADEAKAFLRFLAVAHATLPGLTDAIASDATDLARF